MQEEIILLSVDIGQKDAVVSLSNGEKYELATEHLPPALPSEGQKISREILSKLTDAAERKVIAKKIFKILDRRLQSIFRIKQKLVDDGHNGELIDKVLKKFEEVGLISDEIFSKAYCRDTLLGKTVGKMYLISKLTKFGVPREIANSTVQELFTDELELELCEKAAIKWWHKKCKGDYYNDRQRCQRYLSSRGFGLGAISASIQKIKEREDS